MFKEPPFGSFFTSPQSRMSEILWWEPFSSSILSPLLSKPSRCYGEKVFFYLFSGGCHQKPPGALSCHLPWHHRVQAADRGWRQRSRWNRRWLNYFPFLFCLQESLSFSFIAKSKPFLNIRHCIDLKLTWNCWIPFIMLLLWWDLLGVRKLLFAPKSSFWFLWGFN